MRRFSLTATYNQMAGQIPPPLPAPPYPVPDLVPVKRSFKRHSIANGAEHAAIARQLITTPIVQKPTTPTLFAKPEDTAPPPVDHSVPPPSAPPTIAESVTPSEFESVYNANSPADPDSANVREQLKSDSTSIYQSQESLLSELIQHQPMNGGVEHLHNSHESILVTEAATEAPVSQNCTPKKVPLKKPTPRKSAVIPTPPKETNMPRRVSLPTRDGSITDCELSRETRKHRWSLVEQPPLNRVSQVASAWEQYFNPFGKAKRAQSTESRSRDSSCRMKPQSIHPSRSVTQPQVNSITCTSVGNLSQVESHFNPNDKQRPNASDGNLHTNGHMSQSNSTLDDSNSSRNGTVSGMRGSTRSFQPIKQKIGECSKSSVVHLHSTEPISSTFSSISSVDAFVLLPVKDLVDAYVRCNGSVGVKQSDASSHENAQLSDTTVNQVQLLTSSLSSLSDYVAQISQASSSTITVSDTDTPTEDEPVRYHPVDPVNPLPTRGKLSPVVLMSQSTMQEPGPRSDMDVATGTRPCSIRPRSVSTPNYPRRPLSVTVARHQIQAKAPGTTITSNKSAEQANPIEMARHREAQPHPTHRPEATVTNGNSPTLIGRCDLDTLWAHCKPTTNSGSDQSAPGRTTLTASNPHAAAVRVESESHQQAVSGRRRRITVHNFPRWTETVTSSTQTSVATTTTSEGVTIGHTAKFEPRVCTSKHIIDRKQLNETGSGIPQETEKRTRSLSATSVPTNSYSGQNRSGVLISSFCSHKSMDLTEQCSPVAGAQPFRGMRSRGIYKRNTGSRFHVDPYRGKSSDSPHGHHPYQHQAHQSHTQSVHSRITEPITERTSALSPAAQRYEQHIQAQRQHPIDSHAIRRSNLNWHGREQRWPDPNEGRISPIKHTAVIMPTSIQTTQLQSHLEPTIALYDHHLHNDQQPQQQQHQQGLSNRPEIEEQQKPIQSQPIEPDPDPDPNEDTMDPELWRDKLGLITRWQHEVNTAMQAGETEVDLLLQSPPPMSPSIHQNYSWPQLYHDSTNELDCMLTDTRKDEKAVAAAAAAVEPIQSQQPNFGLSYHPHELMLNSQTTVNTQPIPMRRPIVRAVDSRPIPEDYDNAPAAESTRMNGHTNPMESNQPLPLISNYMIEHNMATFEEKQSGQGNNKIPFDPNQPVSIRCALPMNRDKPHSSLQPATHVIESSSQQIPRANEDLVATKSPHLTAVTSNPTAQVKPLTLDQVLDGVGSPTPRRALPSVAPLPPLAQIRPARAPINTVVTDVSRIEPPIVPVRRTVTKQTSLTSPHVSFDCRLTGNAPHPAAGTRDYEALDVFTNDVNRVTSNAIIPNPGTKHVTETEPGKARGVSKISFSPSYNDALNLCSTNRADGWLTQESANRTQPATGAVKGKAELQGILRTSNPVSPNAINTGKILVPQSTEYGLARARQNGRDSYPIYEGLDNFDILINERNATQWTRVPAPNKRSLAIVPAPAVPTQIFQPSHVSRMDDLDEHGRRRSAARVQLAIPQRSNTDLLNGSVHEPMTSSGLASITNSNLTSTNDSSSRAKATDQGHSFHGVRLRPTLRRAATISPVRQYRAHQEEIADTTQLEKQQPAMSSGFVSAGSIVAAPEEGSDAIGKSGLSSMTKSKTGDFHGLPPPIDVHAYPLVCDLQRGLDKLGKSPLNDSIDPGVKISATTTKLKTGPDDITGTNKQVTYVSGPLQTPISSKFLLGRVASNEDICIQTETPFAFTIAATDKEICITKVASVDDLKRLGSEMEHSTNGTDIAGPRKLSQPSRRAVPVNLRLTFGSESNLAGSVKSRKPGALPSGTSYRVMYHVDIPYGSNVAQFKRDALRRASSVNAKNPFRYSLPCISYREDEPKPITLVP